MAQFHVAVCLSLVTLGCAVQPTPPPTPNPAHEVRPIGTLEGRVTTVSEAFLTTGNGHTAVVTVQLAGNPPVVVQLAPGWYLDERGLHFSREDRITVTGSQKHLPGKIEVQAQSVKKGTVTLPLRDAQGNPLWPITNPLDTVPTPATPASAKPAPTQPANQPPPTGTPSTPTAPPAP